MAELRCVYCDVRLTTGTSYEHIIPQGIGGRLRSKQINCTACNQMLNEKVDVHLVNHLKLIVNLLGVPGTRSTRPIDVYRHGDNLPLRLLHGGVLETKEKVQRFVLPDGTKRFIFHTSNEEEMDRLVEGVQKKHKLKDLSELKPFPRPGEFGDSSIIPMKFHTGDDPIQRALVRILIGYYLHTGGMRAHVTEVAKYVDGYRAARVINPCYMAENFWSSNPPGIFTHSLYVCGNPDFKLLYGFIEVFNLYRYIVVLNRNYSGPSTEAEYHYDVLNRKRTSRVRQVRFHNRLQVQMALACKYNSEKATDEVFHSFMLEAIKLDLRKAMGQKIKHRAGDSIIEVVISEETIPMLAEQRYIPDLAKAQTTLANPLMSI